MNCNLDQEARDRFVLHEMIETGGEFAQRAESALTFVVTEWRGVPFSVHYSLSSEHWIASRPRCHSLLPARPVSMATGVARCLRSVAMVRRWACSVMIHASPIRVV